MKSVLGNVKNMINISNYSYHIVNFLFLIDYALYQYLTCVELNIVRITSRGPGENKSSLPIVPTVESE